MRTTIMLAAAAALLAAAPAFAGNHTPQTNFSGPGSTGSIQQQDMQRSQAQTDQKAQALNHWQAQERDPMNPQMNPHNVREGHHG